MPELMMPNIAGSFQNGYTFGTAARKQRESDADNAQLRGLAPQIINGDPAALAQAAAIDPTVAGKYDEVGQGQLRRLKGFYNYVESARKSGNMQNVNSALRYGAPFISQFIGKQAPTEWTPDMEPGWAELGAKLSMIDDSHQGRVQSTYVDDQGQRVAIMADGSQKVLGGNDSGMSQQTISIPGPNNQPQQYTFDKRTGNYIPAGEGGQSSALGAVPTGGANDPLPQGGSDAMTNAVAESANRMIAAGIPEAQVDQWAQDQLNPGAQQAPQAQPSGPSPFVGRSPEEQAAATTAAQEGVKLQYLQLSEQIKADAAVGQARTIAQDKAQIELGAESAKLEQGKARDAERALGLLDEADRLLPSATGSRSGAFMDDAAAFFGQSTAGAQGTAALKTIAGQLTSSMPRMQGPQSDKDVQLYKEMAGDLANDTLPVATRQAAVQQIRRLQQKYAPQQAAPSNGVDELLSKYGVK